MLETYEVISEAIRGGMGSVWKVHHSSWNVDLAMKRPQPKYFTEGSQGRKEIFIHECRAWINLGLHPNIVSCYYVREIGGVPTVFSEWMDNGSLEDRIRDRTLYSGTEDVVRRRLLDIAIQFARGLHYAHEAGGGLIHQDVKPANLLLTKGWDAKVAIPMIINSTSMNSLSACCMISLRLAAVFMRDFPIDPVTSSARITGIVSGCSALSQHSRMTFFGSSSLSRYIFSYISLAS